MKNLFKNILVFLVLVLLVTSAYSQDRRTVATKVADILAQFPTENNEQADKLMQEILLLDTEGIAKFFELVVPAGAGDDTQARYALASLAQYAGFKGGEISSTVEKAFLAALAETSAKEEKDFFITRLAYCGSTSTVAAMDEFVNDEVLSSPAIVTLTMIGTDEAAQLILTKAQNTSSDNPELVKALGNLKYKAAESFLISKASSSNKAMLQQVYAALAKIGGEASAKTMQKAAKKVNYANDNTEALVSSLAYAKQLNLNGNKTLSSTLANELLKKCKKEDQLIYRSSALKILSESEGSKVISTLLREIKNEDKKYRNAVLQIAKKDCNAKEVAQWISILQNVLPETQAEILHFLSSSSEGAVLTDAIIPSLTSPHMIVRNEAMMALAINQKRKAVPILAKQLVAIEAKEEYQAVEKALLVSCSKDDCGQLIKLLDSYSDQGKFVVVTILAARRATNYFDEVLALCSSSNNELKIAAFEALERLSKPDDLEELISLLEKTTVQKEVESVQNAIAYLFTKEEQPDATILLNKMNESSLGEKLLPLLPSINNKAAFQRIVSLLENGSTNERQAAFSALTKWKTPSSLPVLYNVFCNKSQNTFRKEALDAYLNQVQALDMPADKKLLCFDKIMGECTSNTEKEQVIDAAKSAKTFLSLLFVAKYLDKDQLANVAAKSAMTIALPSAGKKNGFQGKEVRKILEIVKEKLTGSDSQYARIDIQEYLAKMTDEDGYVSIFNGKDLDGWQGLVQNPLLRAKMSKEQLAKAQKEADAKISQNWTVKDGAIVFNGKGQNLCTKKTYKDFEMIVDWKINKDGDSGIYLRGSPQVQIWDTARVDVGAQVGSGGLYNNKINASEPLVLADNAIGEWNTFRIRMVGDKVKVSLNGKLVVDNVIMENYWDRNIPIFREGPIELQAHGNELAFRNLFVREINPNKALLTEEEKQAGFTALFNGENLDNWTGNKIDYSVENGEIIVNPQKSNHGNLYTDKDYSNFIFRFEFQLTSGANNGLGIHAPLEGDAAYVGKELQILDNTAPIYANLQPYQYHGSVYGIIPAKRGALNPVGEWNYQEVIVNGDDIKITLNGQIIIDGNIKEATKNGPMDHKDHPGLNRHTGRIGFLGHGSELKFRNIRIKEL